MVGMFVEKRQEWKHYEGMVISFLKGQEWRHKGDP